MNAQPVRPARRQRLPPDFQGEFSFIVSEPKRNLKSPVMMRYPIKYPSMHTPVRSSGTSGHPVNFAACREVNHTARSEAAPGRRYTQKVRGTVFRLLLCTALPAFFIAAGADASLAAANGNVLDDPPEEEHMERQRARDLGITPGILTPGPLNAITDVDGVQVGHSTIIEGQDVRTGTTVIKPHPGNVFQDKVPSAAYVGNGFGKAIGFPQIQELGEIETPIGLTNTLSIWEMASGIRDYMLEMPENENVGSINPVVGETNDGYLNDIRGVHVEERHVREAFADASGGPVEEGNVGAGTATSALGFKGGIGTSSRVLPEDRGGYKIGVLVQSNFGGVLTINGAPVGEEMDTHYMSGDVPYQVDDEEGSIMIIVATDAPLSPRKLERVAKRSFMALSRVGSFASNGSGDFSIAFSTHPDVRRDHADRGEYQTTELHNADLSPIFLATVEATEEAILNSMFMAEDMEGKDGRTLQALPIEETLEILRKYNAIDVQ